MKDLDKNTLRSFIHRKTYTPNQLLGFSPMIITNGIGLCVYSRIAEAALGPAAPMMLAASAFTIASGFGCAAYALALKYCK